MATFKQVDYLNKLLEKTHFQSEKQAIDEAISDNHLELIDGIEFEEFSQLTNDGVNEMIDYLKLNVDRRRR